MLSIHLARLNGETKLVVTLPPAPNREGLGSWTGNPVVMSLEQIDGMISFLEECRDGLSAKEKAAIADDRTSP